MNEFIGSHFIYTYANGWMYELYVKNEHTVDYFYGFQKPVINKVGRWFEVNLKK